MAQTATYWLPVVAYHTFVQLIAGGPLATLFAGGGPPVVHHWPSVANPTFRLGAVQQLNNAFLDNF